MPTFAENVRRIKDRARGSWRDAAGAAAAGAVAWVFAAWALGPPHAVFAGAAAIVCLAPSLPSHRLQAIGLLAGVATGIVVGALALQVPATWPLLRVGLAAFFAVLIAATYGMLPIVPIQAGVSAMLVLALGTEQAGAARMLDVSVGTAVSMLFSQVLLTPDPLRLLDAAAADLVRELRGALRQAAVAVETGEAGRAQKAVETFSGAQSGLAAVVGAIDLARSNARWSLRGRLSKRIIRPMADRYDRRATRLYAQGLLFGTALASAMARGEPTPPGFAARLAYLIALTDPETAPPAPAPPPTNRAGLSDDWRRAVIRLEDTIWALGEFRALRASALGEESAA